MNRIRTVNLGRIKYTEDLLLLTIITVKGHPDKSRRSVTVGKPATGYGTFGLTGGQKNKSAMRTQPFIGYWTVR